MSGGKYRQTLLHRILSAVTARGANKYNCSRLTLKVNEEKCDVGLRKKYCITVSKHKISSIHKLIQQILGSHKLITPIFDQAYPKIIEITFSLLEFAPAFQKSNHAVNSFLRYRQCQSTINRLATTISDHIHPTFNLCQFASTCKKSGYFIDLFQRYA